MIIEIIIVVVCLIILDKWMLNSIKKSKKNLENDILAKLFSLEKHELIKTEVTDGEDYISESVDIFTDVLNGKNISSKPSINESNPKIILKKTLSTDVDLEENGELLQFIKQIKTILIFQCQFQPYIAILNVNYVHVNL